MSLLAQFSSLPGYAERYEYLVEIGRTLMPLTSAEKTELNTISGCTSKVWCVAQLENSDIIRIRAESRSQIINGMLALLVDELDGLTPLQILAFDEKKLMQAGVFAVLTPTRANGLSAVLRYLKITATVYHHQNNNERV